MAVSTLPFMSWKAHPAFSGANLEPITEAQKSYILSLLNSRKDFSLDEFEQVIKKPLGEMVKGEGSFIIKCLLGEIKRVPLCKCGSPARFCISIKDYGNGEENIIFYPHSLCENCSNELIRIIQDV